jgi:hypothetical protein
VKSQSRVVHCNSVKSTSMYHECASDVCMCLWKISRIAIGSVISAARLPFLAQGCGKIWSKYGD